MKVCRYQAVASGNEPWLAIGRVGKGSLDHIIVRQLDRPPGAVVEVRAGRG